MSRTPARRIGRLKSTLVLAALAVGMVGGAAAPALAAPAVDSPPGFSHEASGHGMVTSYDARSNAQGPPVAEDGEGDFTIQAWSWFR